MWIHERSDARQLCERQRNAVCGRRRPASVRSDAGEPNEAPNPAVCGRRLLVASVVAVSSCSMINVNSLPQPGRLTATGYDIVLQFDNVLNLPLRAKVVLNGVTVGVVTNVDRLTGSRCHRARRLSHASSRQTSEASLQQATVLGDIYVSLERPHTAGSPAPALAPGGTVPSCQTTSPPQLEDTIASLANFVSSGSIQRVQNTIIRLNRVTPPATKCAG